MRQLDPELADQQLKVHAGDLLPPEFLFEDDVRTFKVVHLELRDSLNRTGATISTHSAHCLLHQTGSGLYDDPGEKK